MKALALKQDVVIKKLKAVAFFLLIGVCTFAEDEVQHYETIESHVNGQTITAYLFKSDEQLDKSLDPIIKNTTDINSDSFMPNIKTIKEQIVSLDYIKSNYPKIYESLELRTFEILQETAKTINASSLYNAFGYKYFLYFSPIDNDNALGGLILLLKTDDEQINLSLTLYLLNGSIWYYTNQTLGLIEFFLSK